LKQIKNLGMSDTGFWQNLKPLETSQNLGMSDTGLWQNFKPLGKQNKNTLF
jgi:hypothetical protein